MNSGGQAAVLQMPFRDRTATPPATDGGETSPNIVISYPAPVSVRAILVPSALRARRRHFAIVPARLQRSNPPLAVIIKPCLARGSRSHCAILDAS
jgi:hypothetical protein